MIAVIYSYIEYIIINRFINLLTIKYVVVYLNMIVFTKNKRVII